MYNRIINELEEMRSNAKHELYDLGLLHGFRRMVIFTWFENNISNEEFDSIEKMMNELEKYIITID